MTTSDRGLLYRRTRYVDLPEALLYDLRVSADAVRVWLCMASSADADERFTAADAGKIGMTAARAVKATTELVKAGWLTEISDGYQMNEAAL